MSTDWALARLWLLGSGAGVAATAILSWLLLYGTAPSPLPQADRLPVPQLRAPDTAGARLLYTDTAAQQAALEGEPRAQYRLGLELLQRYREQGERAALEEATEWIRQAAEQDHVRAQLALGALYEKGRGVIQDFETAVQWYRRAADQGEPQAMLRLGQMTEAGKGVSKNLLDAYVWLNLASARGEQRAEMSRDRVRGLLSPEQVNEAQNRSRRLDQALPKPGSPSNRLPDDL